MGYQGHEPVFSKRLADLYVRRYYSSHLSSRVRVLRGVLADGSPQLVYEGAARVHRLSAPLQMGFGDEPQYMVTGTVTLPHRDQSGDAVAPQVNDVVVVLDHQDHKVVGRSFRVMHVDSGGELEEMVQLSVVGSEESPSVPDLPRPPAGWPHG